jgi:hypothetical protein
MVALIWPQKSKKMRSRVVRAICHFIVFCIVEYIDPERKFPGYEEMSHLIHKRQGNIKLAIQSTYLFIKFTKGFQ